MQGYWSYIVTNFILKRPISLQNIAQGRYSISNLVTLNGIITAKAAVNKDHNRNHMNS
jgi:hypothetical protein